VSMSTRRQRSRPIPCILSFQTRPSAHPLSTLSLHDALPISTTVMAPVPLCPSLVAVIVAVPTRSPLTRPPADTVAAVALLVAHRSEEHTSELQSLRHLVCRLLLEKKKTRRNLALSTISITT